jgi:hypothetical protein
MKQQYNVPPAGLWGVRVETTYRNILAYYLWFGELYVEAGG